MKWYVLNIRKNTKEYLMKTFKEFITEKVVKDKETLYIACSIQKQQVKDLYSKFPVKDMKEPRA